ncbi:hypothetical protein CWI38_0020p0030 [Hamiltosporidium tvaerminnensis]|uniref:Uncharacterized protein n=1 Tax=Hamiltosporidium tvaerminnensis TaxID=1176355 RepID=A0A4Q9M3N9_9MICR|nr:hypothetical protein CWI38_0020p0030 [Hamiltosporidium tvaerminnensis]
MKRVLFVVIYRGSGRGVLFIRVVGVIYKGSVLEGCVSSSSSVLEGNSRDMLEGVSNSSSVLEGVIYKIILKRVLIISKNTNTLPLTLQSPNTL